MSNLKHLITLACFLVGANFVFGQTLSITPSSGTYTPNSTQVFTFSLGSIPADCYGEWTVEAITTSNYEGFTGETLSVSINVSNPGITTGDITFDTPPSGTLTINAIATPPAAASSCATGTLNASPVNLTAAEVSLGMACDAVFSEDFQGVAIGTGLSGTNPSASVAVGQGTAFRNGAGFRMDGSSLFTVQDNAGDRRMTVSNLQNGEVYWESTSMNLSPCCSRDISVEIFGTGGNMNDYVQVYYTIDEGGETLIGGNSGNFGTQLITMSSCDISPAITTDSELKIIVRVANNGFPEVQGFDDVVVSEGTILSAPQVLNIDCSGDAISSTVAIEAVSDCTPQFSFNGGAYGNTNSISLASSATYNFSVRNGSLDDCGITSGTFTINEFGNCNFVLPVTLLDFYGRAEADAIGLYWSTSTELNNDFIVVERSLNGIDFVKIGQVEGKGTTTEQQNYTFIDNYPVSGTNYYRLRQVDYDGVEELHSIISVLFDRPLEFGVTISPNPARETLQVDWSLPKKQDGMLRVFDLQGQLMSQRAIAHGSGRYNLPIRDLPAGLYVIQMEQGGKTETLRFVKQ